jgi:MoaE-MoaD fusion protein
MASRIRVRLFAIQREIAGTREVELELPDDATIDAAWEALVRLHPRLEPGRAFVRFALDGDYADPSTPIGGGRELAVIPPVSGGADEGGADEGLADEGAPGEGSAAAGTAAAAGPAPAPRRVIELRDEPFGAGIVEALADRLATDEDGAIVGFVGRTRVTPGTPAPGQEVEAARHAGRSVDALEYESHEPMTLAVLGRIADEIAERFGVERIAIVHRTGEVPLGEASVAVVAVSPHRDAAFRAARYAIDETKARAPIWKAERFADGHVWVGEVAREDAPPDPEEAR